MLTHHTPGYCLHVRWLNDFAFYYRVRKSRANYQLWCQSPIFSLIAWANLKNELSDVRFVHALVNVVLRGFIQDCLGESGLHRGRHRGRSASQNRCVSVSLPFEVIIFVLKKSIQVWFDGTLTRFYLFLFIFVLIWKTDLYDMEIFHCVSTWSCFLFPKSNTKKCYISGQFQAQSDSEKGR